MRKIFILFLLIGITALCFAQLVNESFEGTFPPTGWTNNGYTQTTAAARTGTHCALSNANGQYLITPLLPAVGVLSWYNQKVTGNFNIDVHYSTSTSGPWTLIMSFPAANGWNLNQTDLSSLPKNIYVRFSNNNSPNKAYYLDDISFSARVPSVQASAVNFTNPQPNQATINWTRGNGTNCVVFVREASAGTPGNPTNLTSYTASTNWSSKGTQLDATGYYCVYNGSGTSVTVNNLLASTNYYAIVYEYNGSGVTSVYMTGGATGNTTTLPAAPTVQSTNVSFSNWQTNQFTANWTRGNGASCVVFMKETSVGTPGNPTNASTYTANSNWGTKGTQLGSTGYYCIYNGTGTSVALSNLATSTNYYIIVYEYNGAGSTSSYLINGATGNTATLPNAPTVQVSNVNFTNILLNQVTVNWTRGNGAGCVVFLKEASTGTPGNPANATTYSASTNWNSKGTQLGSTGYYCIYNGTGTSATMANLLAGTNYFVVVFEYNGAGSTSNYLTNGATGNTTTRTHTITLASANPAVVACNVSPGTTMHPIYRFTLASVYAAATLNQVNFTTAGTYSNSDINNFKLWYKSTDDLETASQIGSALTSSLGIGSHSFAGLSQGITDGETGYFWITADLPSTATIANTINVAAMVTGDLTFVSGSKAGTAYTGNTQTITFKSNSADYFRTIATGNWDTTAIWESSHNNITWYAATLKPTGSAIMVYFNHNVFLTANEAFGDVTFNPGGSITLGNCNLNGNGTVTGTPVLIFTGTGVATGSVAAETNPPVADLDDPDPVAIPPVVLNLNVNAGTTVYLPNDVSVVDSLAFPGGSLHLNNKTIHLKKKYFGIHSPDAIMSTLTVTVDTVHVNTYGGNNSIARTWRITGSISSPVNLLLTYPESETAATIVKVWRHDMGSSAAWNFVGSYPTIDNGTTRTVTVTGISNLNTLTRGFSEWTISEADQTLPVELSSFTAFATSQSYIFIQWTTQSETSVSGYYIFRNRANNLATAERVNAFIQATNTSHDAEYYFTDKEAMPGYTWYYWLQHIDMSGETEFHGPISLYLNGVADDAPVIPLKTSLQQVYPNPFNPNTTITFGLAKPSNVNLIIYNGKGEIVRNLFTGYKNAGTFRMRWDGNNDNGIPMTSGVYFVKMNAGQNHSSQKLVLLK